MEKFKRLAPANFKSLKVPRRALSSSTTSLPEKWRPVKLFADCDKDGVANVFDCQPHNARKQDAEFEKKAKQADRNLTGVLKSSRMQRIKKGANRTPTAQELVDESY